MPNIIINEKDRTIRSITGSLANDNIVFIPGNTIKGPTEPTLCTTYNQFITLYGDAPTGSSTNIMGSSWHYATSLLLLGMPVLFKRITLSSEEADLTVQATVDVKEDGVVTTLGGDTAGYETSGASPSTDITGLTTPKFKIAVDGDLTPREITLTTTGNDSGGEIATEMQTKIQAVGGAYAAVTVAFTNGRYVITSGTTGSTSSVRITAGATNDCSAALKIGAANGATDTDGIDATTDDYSILTLTALDGGTYGNRLRVNIVHTTPVNALYNVLLNVYEQVTSTTRTLLESTVLVEGLNGTPSHDITIIKDFFDSLGEGIDYFDTTYIRIEKAWTDGTGVPIFTISETASYLELADGEDAAEDDVQDAIPSIYEEVVDKYIYDIKFFTSGVYTDALIIAELADQAETRGDAIALLDLPYATPSSSVVDYFSSINSSYCAAYAPWQRTRLLTGETKWMPASFVFLYALAKSLRSGGNLYSPPAGVNRGSVADIVTPEYEVGSALLNAWQNDNLQCVNPIMRLRNYGYVIFGQSTLYWLVNGTTEYRSALQDLSVRLTANEIKRAVNNIAISLTFEQNNLRTWNEFRGKLEPILQNLLVNKAINSYDIIIDATTTTNEDIDDNRIRGIVRVEMARAAEKFDIDLELSPSNISLSENTTL